MLATNIYVLGTQMNMTCSPGSSSGVEILVEKTDNKVQINNIISDRGNSMEKRKHWGLWEDN